MDARSFARALTAKLAAPALTRAATRIHVRQARIGHCPGCGMIVRADDVLGLIGCHLAHAECSQGPATPVPAGRWPPPWAADGLTNTRGRGHCRRFADLRRAPDGRSLIACTSRVDGT